MITLGLIGLVGGLIAGISPCILPVLPVIFMSSSTASPAGAAEASPGRRDLTPFAVVLGLAISFSIFTLLGAIALQALPLPDDAIRWTGLVFLLLLGLGMMIPKLEAVLERPFARLQVGGAATGRRGFVLGLALGAVYVPCAGPVLAAITVAGATGEIGRETVVLTVAFAVGTAIPLLGFALAGQRVAQRVRAFREHQRAVRTVAGAVVIALAVALTFNLTDAIQRAVPDYTTALNNAVDADTTIRDNTSSNQSRDLRACADKPSPQLQDCGAAPDITGISSWFNTPGDQSLGPADLKGKVVLIDFWAYSCINCQRAAPHVEAWHRAYADDGLVVIGVHTPEYAFEHDLGNVEDGAKRLGITYPVALDNDYGTWDSFGNNSWPAEYLIDREGRVRHVALGEGDYVGSEKLIRELVSEDGTGADLADETDVPDTTPKTYQSPEMYLGGARADRYSGRLPLRPGRGRYTFPQQIAQDSFVIDGTWVIGQEDIRAVRGAQIALNFTGSKVYLDVAGTGTITVKAGGERRRIKVRGSPNIYPVVDERRPVKGVVLLSLSPGLRAYSFTFG